LSRDLAWEGQGDTCKPPGPRMGHGGALSGACNSGGGPGRRESAGVRGFGRCNGLQATRTSAGERGGRSVLTKGLGRPDCAAQGTGGEVRAAKMTRCSGRSRCGRLWVPGFLDSFWFASWSCCGDATGIRAAGALTAAWNRGGGRAHLRRDSGRNSAHTRVGVGGECFGEVHGVGVELLRGPGPMAGRRSSAGAAAQGALLPRSEGRRRLGFVGRRDERMRAQGFRGGQLKAGRGSWEGVPWGTRTRSPAGRSGSVGALEKERGRRAMTGGSARSVGSRATRGCADVRA
jgi:hypothetical protein